MTSPWWQLDWVWQFTGLVVGLLGLGLLLWALFWDRSRGRKRCPRCWYDMTGAVAVEENSFKVWTCPECGHRLSKERRLFQTRRRWRLALLALLLCLVGGAGLSVPIYRKGWDAVPTKVLIETFSISGPHGFLGQKLLERFGYSSSANSWFLTSATVTPSDRLYLVNRVRYGNLLARPGSSRWRDTYGLLPHTMSQEFDLGFAARTPMPFARPAKPADLTDAIKSLYELPLDVRFVVRDPWPTDVPVFVGVDVVNPWPWPTGFRVTVRRKDERNRVYETFAGGFVVANPPASGVLELEYDIQQIRQAEPNAEWTTIEHRSISVPLHIKGLASAAIQPVTDPSIDAMVARISYSVGAGIMTDVGPTQCPETDGLAFGVIMEHRLNGKPMAHERLWWRGGPRSPLGWGLQREWIDGTGSAWSAKAGEVWTMHIVSDRDTALRVADARRYWDGEVDIPVNNQSRKK